MQAQVHFKVSNSLGLQGASPPRPLPGRCPWNPPGALKQVPGPPTVRATAPLAAARYASHGLDFIPAFFFSKPVLMPVLLFMKSYLARAIDSE